MGTTNEFFRGLGTSGRGSAEDKDTWRSENAASEPFGTWARRTRTPSGMDEEEQALAHSLEARAGQINAAAQAESDARISGRKPKKGA